MRWTIHMNRNALQAYFRAKEEAYRVMHRFFPEPEPSITITELKNDDLELERLRHAAVPPSDENATAGDAAQVAHADSSMKFPAVVDSDYDGIATYEVEKTGSTLEEAITERRSTLLENHNFPANP
ncbi:unnamed protein product [Parnassius apollo]|uniref:(apollo) hypothetical protein n=1 Tax=Parnassius apollo TaxID=110799 RepID=A0A8S3XIU9_PARAO|nr:unnamed protein product [Parnassius apollo]